MGRIPQAHAMKRKPPMSRGQFRAALARLGLNPYSCGPRLGIGRRQAYRIAAGHTPVNRTLALLVLEYLKNGLPPLAANDESPKKKNFRDFLKKE
jgi:hypothetical protein